ncbi:putative phage abortive infection protein [Bacillus wiedmannii]|uniref:putative phage abortive infection protein n=1 Tax=Bacillus wiedmannii TaxID=1890302 RepID=UPI00211D3670|nr:putative phage abortive infection protein [Bacillus wiedmannii]
MTRIDNGKSNKSNEENKNTEGWAKFFTWIGFALVPIAMAMPFIVYHFDFSYLEKLGPIGDFIGGTTVTFLTGASVFLLIATNIMQRKELQMSRQSIDEMVKQTKASVEQMTASVQQAEEARKETQITNETMKRQQFETTFFNMLTLHHQIVNEIKISYYNGHFHMTTKQEYVGREAFIKLKSIFESKLAKSVFVSKYSGEEWNKNSQREKDEYKNLLLTNSKLVHQEYLNKVYKDIQDEYGNAIGHYMRNNYRIVKFIVENVADNEEEQRRVKKKTGRDMIIGDKRFYLGTLRAQWSNAEFELILINSLYEKNYKFKDLIKKYDVLDIKETDKQILKGKPEGSFVLKANTIIPPAYNSLIENE